MTMDTTRRRLLKAAPAVGLTACLPAVAEAAPAMTRDEMIAHHMAELFRLLGEDVPEGTALTMYSAAYCQSGRHFYTAEAKAPEAALGLNGPYHTSGYRSWEGHQPWKLHPGRAS